MHINPSITVDANLQIMDEKGNLLAQNLDHHGLDPQIVFSAPAYGNYLVRVFGFPSEPTAPSSMTAKRPTSIDCC